jgi:hypothetical protein
VSALAGSSKNTTTRVFGNAASARQQAVIVGDTPVQKNAIVSGRD